jgi:VanZ family protein
MLLRLLNLLHLSVSPETFWTLHSAIRKLAHVYEYAILSILLYLSFHSGDELDWQVRLASRCILGATLYAISDELHQTFVRGRGASVVDCFIDLTGAALGMLLIYVFLRHGSRSGPRKRQAA